MNFRAKHWLRDYVSRLIEPIFSNYIFWNTEYDMFSSEKLEGDNLLFWKQAGARHYPEYYHKLSSSTSVLVMGVYLQYLLEIKISIQLKSLVK